MGQGHHLPHCPLCPEPALSSPPSLPLSSAEENREYVCQRVPRGSLQDTMNTQCPGGTGQCSGLGAEVRQDRRASCNSLPTRGGPWGPSRPPSLLHRQPNALRLMEKCPPHGHSNSFSSDFLGLLKEFRKVTPSGLGDDRFSLSLGQHTTPTSHQGVVLLEMGPVAAEHLCQGGLAHCWVSCEVRGEENHHCHPDLTGESPTPER